MVVQVCYLQNNETMDCVGSKKDNGGNSDGGGGRQQSTKMASGRNDGSRNGDSNEDDADANNLAARDCTIASAVSVGGSDGENESD